MGHLRTTAAAWKCGLPLADAQWGTRVIAAPIHAGTLFNDSPCPVWARQGAVRIEPELAFVLGTDLPPRERPYAAAEVESAVASVHLALELIDTRYDASAQPGYLDMLADGLVNQGLFIGPAVDRAQAFAACEMALECRYADGRNEGRAGKHPAGLPAAPLYWLAEWLRQRGQGLKAGQAIITGSYAGTLAMPVGERIEIRFGDLGTLDVVFDARSAAAAAL